MSKTVEISAPIHIKLFNNANKFLEEDWLLFENWIAEVKTLGVNSIVVPILWGMVEDEKHVGDSDEPKYNWTYYDRVFDILFNNKIKCTPEFVFHFSIDHQENYMKPIPAWIWGDLLNKNPELAKMSNLKFVSETGDKSFESLSIWIDDYSIPYYRELLNDFKLRYSDRAYMMDKVIISMGPKGELRYPSFDLHDWGAFPNRGTLQCYSDLAIDSYKTFCKNKYLEIEILNQHWKKEYRSFNDIEVSTPQNNFINEKNYSSDTIAIDFSEWYNESLLTHGTKMLTMMDEVFSDNGFKDVKIAFKVAGIHWMISDPVSPRLPEIVSGIIKSHKGISSLNHGEYKESFNKIIPEHLRHRIVIHYSGAEKVNRFDKEYSHGEDLSTWIRNACHDIDVECVAENSYPGGLYSHEGWNQIERNLFGNSGFDGLNIISLRHILNNNELGKQRFIKILNAVKNDKRIDQSQKKTFRVMNPLHLKVLSKKGLLEKDDLVIFDSHLKQIKDIGVSAVSVDVWWGLVMRENEDVYDWSYYRQIVELLKNNGLNWVPIFSFHQAGGNVNDDFSQMIPLWVWGSILNKHKEIDSIRDLQYISETGDSSTEYISLWADKYALPLYENFMNSFKEEFSDIAWMTEEINVSMGTAGELRYPSFNSHDWGDFPNRGTLQCYSQIAKKDFEKAMRKSYQSIDELNQSWKTNLNDFSEITPPQKTNYFFDNKDYIKSKYGRDFIFWYNDSLISHGKRILKLAFKVFDDNNFESTDIGFKIPGVHWKISDPNLPRVAEITAGLISSHTKLSSNNQDEYCEMLKRLVKESWKDRIVVHFTCLEMVNKDDEGYSRAEDLVKWMSEAAHKNGIRIMGENALAGEIYNKEGWDQMEKALEYETPYNGLTILRMGNLISGNEYGIQRYKELINKFS
ncbi:MAG: family 14 glycosylhydrolase [Flavobacteriales bacterium]|nr:family 14 glycosylhydrolase [Flavobacteriales bacterium]